MKKIINLLKEKNITLGSVESLTGGLFASMVTSFSGVSSFYKGSIISYATKIKEDVVGVDKSLINKFGVVSKEIAQEMCLKGAKRLNVDMCISFTGNAGPNVMENKPVGLVYVGLCYLGQIEVVELHLSGDRNQIREQVIQEGIKIIQKKLDEIK